MFQKWPRAMQRKGHGPIAYGKRLWGGQSNMSLEPRAPFCWPGTLLVFCLVWRVFVYCFWRPTAPHHPSFLYFSTFLSELVCVGRVQEARLHLHFHCRIVSMRESPGADSVGCSPLTPRLLPPRSGPCQFRLRWCFFISDLMLR